VRAAGVNPSDWKKRQGLMDRELPQTMGYEAAGVVDELGEGVADVAAALPAAVETATRALDQLGVGSGSTLLINGASGSVGSAAVQLAVARGARVIGTASPANHGYLRSLGAEPVAYGEGLAGRVRALAPDGVGGAQEHGVRFSSGDAGRAVHALAGIGELIESGRFLLLVAQTFLLAEIAAHWVGEDGHMRGKLVLVVGWCGRNDRAWPGSQLRRQGRALREP
jgi:NADPH:quinone reductase-like Zn-dependent oxidoreductase